MIFERNKTRKVWKIKIDATRQKRQGKISMGWSSRRKGPYVGLGVSEVEVLLDFIGISFFI